MRAWSTSIPRLTSRTIGPSIVDPVGVWLLGASAPEEAPTAQLEQAAEYFHAALRMQIQNDFELVDAPETAALHLRLAIVDTRGSTADPRRRPSIDGPTSWWRGSSHCATSMRLRGASTRRWEIERRDSSS